MAPCRSPPQIIVDAVVDAAVDAKLSERVDDADGDVPLIFAYVMPLGVCEI